MLAELLAHPGVREECELRSRFGFLALHGGSLEQVTDHVAVEAARRSGASVYALVQPPDFTRHVPATKLDPADSPTLAAFLDHVDEVVSIHGFGVESLWRRNLLADEAGDESLRVFATDLPYDPRRALLLGGTNRELAAALASELRVRLPDHEPVDDLDAIPTRLRGLHPRNPVNLPRQGGAQLECCPDVRGLTPRWPRTGLDDHPPEVELLIQALATVARTRTPP